MRLIPLIATWAVVSVPISVASGFFLAAGRGDQPEPIRMRHRDLRQPATSSS